MSAVFDPDRDELLGLTLWRPWPDAILRLPEDQAKRVENRLWKPSRFLGRGSCGRYPVRPERALWIALHGGLHWDDGAVPEIRRRLCEAGVSGPWLPESHVLGVARLDHVLVVGELTDTGWREETRRHGFWLLDDDDSCGWVLTDVTPLQRPVRCSGNRSLWQLPPDVRGRVLAQLPRESRALRA